MDSPATDGELIEAVLDGRQERFSEIVARYRAALLRAAESRLKRRDLAEDAVQETFLCVFRSLHTYDSRYSFRTWLWTILLNQCGRRHKRECREIDLRQRGAAGGAVAPPLSRGGGATTDFEPAAAAIAREQAAQLELLLDRLPDVQADALRLRFFGGLKFHEIADAMACSLSSAKARVRMGLTRMSELMNEAAAASVERSEKSL